MNLSLARFFFDNSKAIAALVHKESSLSGKDENLPKYIRKLIDQKRLRELKKIEGSADPEKKLKVFKSARRKERYAITSTVKEVVQVQREVKREEQILEDHIKEKEKLRLHGDLYSILTLMFMQDGPFLILRLYMIVSFEDVEKNEMHLFFTGKNAVALFLLMYRLVVLIFEAKEDDDDEDEDEDSQLEYTTTTRMATLPV